MGSDTLSDRDELLIERFRDGECGWWSRIRAKRLLASSKAAVEYLALLDRSAGLCQLQTSRRAPVDLWSRVAARIEAEERAERYLGKRIEGSRRWVLPAFGYGAAGFVTAGIVFAVALGPVGSNSGGGIQSPMVKVNPQNRVFDASLVSSGGGGVPSQRGRRLGVDWMRSDGRVEMMHGADGGAPVIWVKRRRSGMPLLGERNSSGIVMYGQRAPLSSSVASK